jgi:hypothetical protein
MKCYHESYTLIIVILPTREAHISWAGFELTTLVVRGTDCIGSYKSNYHTITITTASQVVFLYLINKWNVILPLINKWNVTMKATPWLLLYYPLAKPRKFGYQKQHRLNTFYSAQDISINLFVYLYLCVCSCCYLLFWFSGFIDTNKRTNGRTDRIRCIIVRNV